MKNIATVLAAAVLILSTTLVFAADVTVKVPDAKGAAKATASDAKGAVKSGADSAKSAATDARSAAKAKVIDINTATEAELKAVPGIGDAYAAKIVAGRPYANKSQLKSRNILPAPVYEKVKDQIVAKQAKK